MSFVQANLRAQLNVTMEPKDWRAVAPKLDARGCRLETRENALGRDPISYQTLLDLSREDRDAPAMLEDVSNALTHARKLGRWLTRGTVAFDLPSDVPQVACYSEVL